MIKKHVKKAMFMTLVLLCWDHKTKKLTYVGAGHEHILVYRAESGECEAIMSGGVAIGMVPDNSKIVSENQELPLDTEYLTQGIAYLANGGISFHTTNKSGHGILLAPGNPFQVFQS